MTFLLHDRPDSAAFQALILTEAEAARQQAERSWRVARTRRLPDFRGGAFQ
ncbi:hypothetical protein RCO27_17925 [Sphingosinicella sp. LHD-64]|uniref:hypothetical protein n=1 Tax=Sphingosinicella sp. LHD-64 TaxID=3072139 RepID=UPI00280E3818|nr:hypothetical protein [Sphingosinicella sp. LHD-64]MDQ8758109.1 hypothetical protein [Sphingosinicella sp. LHD-64]